MNITETVTPARLKRLEVADRAATLQHLSLPLQFPESQTKNDSKGVKNDAKLPWKICGMGEKQTKKQC